MKFDKVNYDELKLDANASVSKIHIALVEKDKPKEVSITDDECKRSVRTLSRLKKE